MTDRNKTEKTQNIEKASDKYNQRQFKLMLALIEDYENGNIGIHRLVNDIEALTWVLEDVAEDKRNLLLSYWGALEDVYADALYEEVSELDQESCRIVADALSMLKKIIGDELILLKTKDCSSEDPD